MAPFVVFDLEARGDGGTEDSCDEESKGEGGEGVKSWMSSA